MHALFGTERGGIFRSLLCFLGAMTLIAGALGFFGLIGPDGSAGRPIASLALTKEEMIDQWFRSRVREAYRVEVVGQSESDAETKMTVSYYTKDKIVGLVRHEATFSFDAKGKLFAVQGDEPVMIRRGVAVR